MNSRPHIITTLLLALLNGAVGLAVAEIAVAGASDIACTSYALAEPQAAPARGACPDLSTCAAGTSGTRIAQMTQVIAPGPGAFMHLRADTPPAATDVWIGGTKTAPMYVDEPNLGAVYALPQDLRVCPVAVSVGPRDGNVSDCRVLTVVPPHFEEVAREAGVAVLHNTEDELAQEFPASTGLAFGDYDGDGDADLYIANFGIPGVLFRNDSASGQWRFSDQTAAAGLDGVFRGSAVTFVDIDGDGDLDLYVGRDGIDRLFRNQLSETGAPTFVDITESSGLVKPGQSDLSASRTTGIAFGDYDQDGRLDLYVASHITHLNTAPDMHQDRLYWNAGNHFEEVTHLLDDRGPATRLAAFAATWLDVDRDGDPDLVVASDHDAFSSKDLARPNVLWRNDGPADVAGNGRTWRFQDVSDASRFGLYPDGKGQGLNAMGLAFADLDDDGDPDFAMSNIGPNVLLRNDSKPGAVAFTDVAAAAGITRTYLPWQPRTPAGNRRAAWQDMSITWGALFLDGDNDGDDDLFMAGGAPVDNFHGGVFGRRPIPNAYFANNGQMQFVEQTFASGLADPGPGMGAVHADVDRDGWMDLAVFSYKGRFRLYRNRGAWHWPMHRALRVVLQGRGRNAQAVGSEATLTFADGRARRCFMSASQGLAGGSEVACHFGLGAATPSALEIRWPDATTSTVTTSLKANTALHCVQPE